jgi:hypothetical protein
MRKVLTVVSLLIATKAFADEISLFDWGLYLNGNVICSTTDLPRDVTFSDNFFETGTGTVTMTFESATPTDLSIAMFFDYEIDELTNTFYNEYGITSGTLVDPRLLYEIDEPGFGTDDSYRNSPDAYNYIGDIYDNFSDFLNLGFDNYIYYDWYTDTYLSDFENPVSDDVSMAMGWNFSLSGNETAVLQYTVSTIAPATGFYLAQLDRDSPETGIYLQSRLNITPVGVPESHIVSLFGMGIISLCFFPRKTNK